MSAPRSTTLTAGVAAILTLGAASAAMLSAQQSAPLYKDASRPVAERVADLLGRMTLEEKVAQLTTRWTTLKPLQDAEGTFVPAGAPALLGQGLGQLARPSEIGGTEAGPHVRGPRKQAEFTNAVQKWVLENTRLGIPVMFHEEALHGFVAPQATHFPVPLGLGATWQLNESTHFIIAGRFFHISNAAMKGVDENPGFNGAGGYAGLLFKF